ncbi:tetratricopeptide repeat protein [Calycomorphotria hydatis]|uniref:Lipoprotein NlpI n=1 Tax=Calycomorphotria hydatis TaxID=2528027 RepID=A0A517TDE8_9PLAN|nr:tetratricopeptide repeat protein [Calycomorphotria hydatis]QDT66395.1 lipoprotein NlpI [Calycomorphotria hydatis]
MPDNPDSGHETHSSWSWRLRFAGAVGLFVFTTTLFSEAIEYDFIYWDDQDVVADNPHVHGLSRAQVHWMWTEYHMGHYHPLTWMSYGLDFVIAQLVPGATYSEVVHLTNILLHASSTVFVFILCESLLKPYVIASRRIQLCLCACVLSLLWACHPLRVESVVWATERRDVLSVFFLIPCVLVYVSYTRTGNYFLYILALLLYTLSLLSKAWGITLGAVLLFIDVYPLGRLGSFSDWRTSSKLMLEKLPYFVIGLFFAYFASQAQRISGAAVDLERHTTVERLIQSCAGLVVYPYKTFFPIALSPIYSLPEEISLYEVGFLVPCVITVLVVGSLPFWCRRAPALATAICVYGILVSPVLGLMQSGPQLAADRYSYLCSIPLFIFLAAALFQFWSYQEKWSPLLCSWSRKITIALFLALICGAVYRTYAQMQVWRNDVTFAVNVAERTGDAVYLVFAGDVYLRRNDFQTAFVYIDRAVRYAPDSPISHFHMGKLLYAAGKYEAAVRSYLKGIELRQENKRDNEALAKMYTNLGLAYRKLNRMDDAVDSYSKALEYNPADENALLNRCITNTVLGRYELATADAKAYERLGLELPAPLRQAINELK